MREITRFLFFVALALLLFGSGPPVRAAEDQGPGAARSPVPEAVSAKKHSAQPPARLDLSPWRGKVVLLDFWASWCEPCRESFPWMAEMVRKYGHRGLVVVTVNVDHDRSDADRFLAEGRRFDFQFLYDPEGRIARAYDIQAMPTSILFGRDGKESVRHSGFRTEEEPSYEDHIAGLLAVAAGEASAEGSAAAGGDETGRRRFGARPWERGLLARACMRFDGNPIDLSFDDHIYFSREASSGGRGFGGGGCGCN